MIAMKVILFIFHNITTVVNQLKYVFVSQGCTLLLPFSILAHSGSAIACDTTKQLTGCRTLLHRVISKVP